MAEKHQFIDLRSVLRKYLYHWPLFVSVLILALAAAYIYLNVANPVYEISATILVKDDKKSPDDKAALPELEQSSSPKNAEAEIEILKSKNLIGQVVDTLQLWAKYTTAGHLATKDLYLTSPFKFVLLQKGGSLRNQKIDVLIQDKKSFVINNLSGREQTVAFSTPVKDTRGTWMLVPTQYLDQYAGSKIKVSLSDPQDVSNNYVKNLDAHLLDKLAPTIGLFITDEVPERGQDFLNRLISVYNQAGAAEQKRTTKQTIDFIDNRLASLSTEVNHAEGKVQNYRSSQGLTDINSVSKSYLETVQTNDQKLNDVNVQLQVINGIEAYVNSPSNNTDAPATIGINDPALSSLVEKLSKLQLQRSALLATTPETNTGVFDPINRQIALTKQSLKTTVTGIKASLLNSKKQLEAFNNKYQSSIKDIPVQERHVGDMQRQQNIKENLYTYLLQKREELALSYASTYTDARVVDQANIGEIKWPKPGLLFALAVLLGLGIPFLIIYLRDTLNNKITQRRDIESVLTNIPVIAELSYEDADNGGVVATTKHSLISEQFRTLRTNLSYVYQHKSFDPVDIKADMRKGVLINESIYENRMSVEGEGRVTLLTSSISREGKSFVSTNLASSLAASGRRTVLLEMDLRKPRIASTFDLPANHPGISDYLSHNIPIRSIVQPSAKIPNLDIIGCGHLPQDPAELLEKDRLAELISDLRDHYDDIIIDSPPLHLVTDAMIIARVVDVSLYLIRQGYTGKDELTFLKEFNENQKLPNVNIVFNGIRNSKYGYGYTYENSYYSTVSSSTTFKSAFSKFLSRF